MPDMTPEEHQRRGDGAEAMFREFKRLIAEKLATQRTWQQMRVAGALRSLGLAAFPWRPTDQTGTEWRSP